MKRILGRLIHEINSAMVDYNRAGTSLVEIVTEPDFENSRQVREFLNVLSSMLENLQVTDTDLEGAIRVDVNVSTYGNKVEVKNVNSFRGLEKVILFEITRQKNLHSRNINIDQETRHWDAKKKITTHSRSKEGDADYRYVLEGDIPWIIMEKDVLDDLKSKLPENIGDRRDRYIRYGIVEQVADILSSDGYYSDLFENACTCSNAKRSS